MLEILKYVFSDAVRAIATCFMILFIMFGVLDAVKDMWFQYLSYKSKTESREVRPLKKKKIGSYK